MSKYVFNKDTFEKFEKPFTNAVKCVLKEKISNNPTKLKEYERNLITTYNQVIRNVAQHINNSEEIKL